MRSVQALTGFTTKSTQPDAQQRDSSSSDEEDVTKMTGICSQEGVARSSAVVRCPSISGMETSMRIKSGVLCLQYSIACSPESTEKQVTVSSSKVSNMSLLLAWSSTINTLQSANVRPPTWSIYTGSPKHMGMVECSNNKNTPESRKEH